jgi:DNA-binding NarL/FixJ family response regulator
VLKGEAPERLIGAIEAVARGEHYFPTGSDVGSATAIDERLTPREREILQLIAEGKRNSEIAQIMSRSLHTVRNHRARLMRKLGVHSATELVQKAEEMGLVWLQPAGRKG